MNLKLSDCKKAGLEAIQGLVGREVENRHARWSRVCL